MGDTALESYVSERSALIVERFLFADKLENEDLAALEAIKNATAVLISQQLSGHGEADIVPATIEKVDLMKRSTLLEEKTRQLKGLHAHFLESPRGQLSLPPPTPLLLPVVLVSHILRLTKYMLSQEATFDQQLYFSVVREARAFAQKLSRDPVAFHQSRWLEGLCYVWQAIGAGPNADIQVRNMLFNHAKKLLIEATGTNIYDSKITGLDALENPCSAVIGALCDYMGYHLEAIWWYRKYKAENAIFTFDELLPELASYLTLEGEAFRTVSEETRAECLEQVSIRKYAEVAKLQAQVNEAAKKANPSLAVSTFKPEPETTIESPFVVSIPIGLGRSNAGKAGKPTIKMSTDNLEYATSPPKSSSGELNLRRSNYLASPTSQPVTTVNTSQFLERSRANFERSTFSPFVPTATSPLLPPRYETPEYTITIDTSIKTETAETTENTENASPKPETEPMVVSPHTEPLKIPVLTEIIASPDVETAKVQPPSAVVESPALPKETIQERLKRRVALYGLKEEKEVPGDGNCQFYSLSDQLYNDFQHAAQIRQYCVAWLYKNSELELENGAKLKEFGFNDDGWEAYLAMMSLSGTWGDHLTLVACAELFQVRIVIVTSAADESQAVIEIVPTTTGKETSSLSTIYLCHYAEFHYGTLREG